MILYQDILYRNGVELIKNYGLLDSKGEVTGPFDSIKGLAESIRNITHSGVRRDPLVLVNMKRDEGTITFSEISQLYGEMDVIIRRGIEREQLEELAKHVSLHVELPSHV